MSHELIGNGCARALERWIEEDAQLGLMRRLRFRYGSYWFEKLLQLQTTSLAEKRGPIEPVFVHGFWRSGTSLLHNWLALGLDIRTPTTWECFRPATHGLRAAGSVATANRPMDEGQIRDDAPQEDEFALLLLGAPSLYRSFLRPDRAEQIWDEVMGTRDALPDRWLDFVTGLASAEDPHVLLKSPNHLLRVAALRARFPGSPEIWIGRDFAQCCASTLKMWQTMTARHALVPVPEGAIEALVLRLATEYRNVLGALLDSPPAAPVMWVEYESLRTSPLPTTQRIGEQLKRTLTVHEDPLLRVEKGRFGPSSAIQLPHAYAALVDTVDQLHAEARARWAV